jgi:diguanylate cyclase (GGDEF)-like protein
MGILADHLKTPFDDTDTEFRESHRLEDLEQARAVITIVAVMVAAFSYVDLLFYKLTGMFYILVAVRVLFCVLSYVVGTGLKRHKKLHQIDLAIFFWTISLAILTLGVNLVRPSYFNDNILLHSVMILGTYVLLPNRFIFKIIPAIAFTIGEMWILIFYKDNPTLQGLFISAVAFTALNVIGILSARRQEFFQRKQYKARLLENGNRIQLLGLATTDSLTGIFNRRHFLELGEIEFDRYKRFGHIFSFVVIDINKFKSINDTYGHPIGDLVLQVFCDVLSREKRSVDIIGRLGGDEFGIILPETSSRDAAKAIQRINRACRNLKWDLSDKNFQMTISTGLTVARPGDQSIDDLYRRADKRLYTKKQKIDKSTKPL